MKIAIDLTALADNFSGIERYAAYISLELIQHQEIEYVLIFKGQVHELFLTYQQEKHIECVVLPACHKLLFNQVRLPWALHHIKADAYLFMAFPMPILACKKNMISTIHDICCWDCPDTMNEASKWYFRVSYRMAVKKCRAITTVSAFSKQRIMSKLQCSEEKIFLVYDGVDERFFAEKDTASVEKARKKYHLPETYLLTLSTLEPRKKLDLLLEAYAHCVTKGELCIPLVLAGRKGWKVDSLLEHIDPKVRENIILTGFIDDEDIVSIYHGASGFVFPSMYEGFGIPPLEAMAAGVPVLSSDAASLPEVLGDAAIYFRSNDVADLQKKMVQMMYLHDDDRKSMYRAGRKQAACYNWKEQAENLLDEIKRM